MSVCGPEITIFCIFIRWERFLEFSKLTAARSKGLGAEEQELFLFSSVCEIFFSLRCIIEKYMIYQWATANV